MGSRKDFGGEGRGRRRRLRRGGVRPRACAASSTWAAWARGRSSPSTCAAGSRPATGCDPAGVPVVELRASIVIGSGSLSYEMVRALVERLPVMICPQVGAGAHAADRDRRPRRLRSPPASCPGAEGVLRGRRPGRRLLPRDHARVRAAARTAPDADPRPFLTPRLSSLWLGLVTPLYARVGRTLIESLRTPTVVTSDRARTVFPNVRPAPVAGGDGARPFPRGCGGRRHALDAAVSSAALAQPWGGARYGARLVDTRARVVAAPPHRAFAPVRRLGGAAGWYWGNALWRLRGALDVAAGGAGMRRGRHHPHLIRIGDALDFWRVEGYEEDRLLRLEAEDAPARPRLAAVRGVARRRGSLRDPADPRSRSRPASPVSPTGTRSTPCTR